MTKSQLIERIARRQSQLGGRDVELAVKMMLEHLASCLAAGGRIEIRGFGSFSLRFHRGRIGRNPRTGAPVSLPSKHRPVLQSRARCCASASTEYRPARAGDRAAGSGSPEDGAHRPGRAAVKHRAASASVRLVEPGTNEGRRCTGEAGLAVAEVEPGLCRRLARQCRAGSAGGAAVSAAQAERGGSEGVAVEPARVGAPWLKQHGAPFWADVPMLEGRALDTGEAVERTLRRVVVRCGATFWGLRLRDGALVLRVARGREAEQIWMADGVAFDPWRGGLEIAVPADASPAGAWGLVERLAGTVFAR